MSRPTHIVVCVALAVASLALYWPTTDFDFVNLDDHGYVLENEHLAKGLSPGSLGWILEPHHSNWAPLTWLSFSFAEPDRAARRSRHCSLPLHGASRMPEGATTQIC